MAGAETEGPLWDQGAEGWAEFQEAQFQVCFEDALTAASAGPGARLLDVGCGSGLLLRLAAERGAAVAGLDASPGLLQVARRTLPEGADLRVGDLESLPFGEAEFDIVTAFNALRYATDAVAAVRGFARAVKPGGRIVVGGWGEPRKCETTGLLFAVLALLPEPPDWSGSSSVNTPTEVRETVRRAGLPVTFVKELSCPFVYPDRETAWRALSATGLLRQASATAGEDAVRKVFDEYVNPSVRPDGSVVQHNVCEYTVTRVP
ncbi:class I SAM-dependent methyltransferase [Streptomyces sp. NPDC048172]|uniref:class I SAM-dependent methyltransferase n=1 Tax=Streptomyces sp. NPDC048172 TaxID=3365505 RepID=UPI003723D405